MGGDVQGFQYGSQVRRYTYRKNALEIINIAAGFNLKARIIGHCEASDKKGLTIVSEFGEFKY